MPDGSISQPAQPNRTLQRDLKTLIHFIAVYCHDLHDASPRASVTRKTHDLPGLSGQTVELCPACAKLLAHALLKRSACTRNPKPACKHCPSHCYHPAYRRQIREVMKYSGRKLLLRGRLDYLKHLFF